jgi:hypothetical protein
MPNVNTPRGFRTVNSVAGAPYSGAIGEYRIASGSANTICQGDAVKLLATGYVDRAGAATAIRGIFVGVRYTQADGTPKFDNKWIGGTVTLGAGDAVALVHDDAGLVVEAKFTGAATNPALADIGQLYDLADATGSSTTGLSAQGVDITTAATSLKQFRFLGFVARPDNDTASSTSAYAAGRFALVNHDYRLQTGI